MTDWIEIDDPVSIGQLSEPVNIPQVRTTERKVTPVNPDNPAKLGYPPTFPVEIAMRNNTVPEICDAYHITPEEWEVIRVDPVFLGDLQRAIEMLKEEGMSFRVKARLQAEELLQTSWSMIHSPGTPPAVAADLIKTTARWAQYDNPGAQGIAAPGSGFHISFNFNGPQPDMKVINGDND